MALDRTRTLRGALAGAAAAAVWAAQQPLDQRVFEVPYDDVELLGRFVTDGRAAYPVGLAMHIANGAVFGAIYANAARALPIPPVLRGPLAGLAEHLATWPGTAALVAHPPRRRATSRSSGARAARSPRPPGGTCCSAPCSASSSGA